MLAEDGLKLVDFLNSTNQAERDFLEVQPRPPQTTLSNQLAVS